MKNDSFTNYGIKKTFAKFLLNFFTEKNYKILNIKNLK